jgi:hypothetical protein
LRPRDARRIFCVEFVQMMAELPASGAKRARRRLVLQNCHRSVR